MKIWLGIFVGLGIAIVVGLVWRAVVTTADKNDVERVYEKKTQTEVVNRGTV